MYDELAPKLIERGLHPVPIGPGTKCPSVWNRGNYTPLPDWPSRLITSSQPGAGIGVVLGDRSQDVVAIDLDDDEIAIALLDVLPDSPVRKTGRRGESLFYCTPGLQSRKFKINGKVVCEILSSGTQTVIPPSIHPVTRQAYQWTGPKTLLDIDPADLPRLPDDIVQRIEGVLRHFGYESGPGRLTNGDAGESEFDSPFAQLNAVALRRLAEWVPALDLFNCRRVGRRYASYEAVATWRPSSSGRPNEQRARNLRISTRGIKDFGTDKGYSALDLVMARRACSFSEAMEWLDEKLQWSKGGPEIFVPETESPPIGNAEKQSDDSKSDITTADATASRSEDPQPEKPQSEETAQAQQNADEAQRNDWSEEEARQDEADERFLRSQGAWFCGEALPEAPTCSFEGLFPEAGAGMLVAREGCNKTYVSVDLAVAFASDAENVTFAGCKRLRRGAVVLIEFEHSQVPLRIQCAALHRGVDYKKLPIVTFEKAPSILLNKKKDVDPAAIKWYRATLGAVQRRLRRRGLPPLAMVGVDPLINAAGFDNESDSVEAHEAMQAFRDLAQEFNCLFVVNDHAGKDPERGARGSSAKPAKADFILMLPEKIEDHTERRTMKVKKLRNLPDGWGVDLWFELIEAQVADGVLASNLAACWGEKSVGTKGGSSGKGTVGRPPKLQRLALKVLGELLAKVTYPSADEIPWVSLESWYEALIDQTIIEPDDPQRRFVFKRVKDGLLEKGEIKIRGDKVCIPLQP